MTVRDHVTYTYEEVADLIGRVPVGTKSLLDLGAGLRDGNISGQVAKLPLDRLITIEAFEPYIPILSAVPVQAKEQQIICADICSVELESVDCAIMLDVLEHLDKESGLALIAKLKEITKSILIFIPLGDTIGYFNDFKEMGNQDLQTHKSAWYASELHTLGFDVDVYLNFHTHVLPDQPVHAAWAKWTKSSSTS